MACLSLHVAFLSILALVSSGAVVSQPPPERDAVYRILESINSDVPWRTLYPDDLCSSGPHGVVCDYFSDGSARVTELSLGYISDYSPDPPCSSGSTLDVSLLAPLSHIRKLLFYRCFRHNQTPFPYFESSSLEELVFIENEGLTGSIDGRVSNLRGLRRLILSGSNISGGISDRLGQLTDLEELTLSRSRFNGEIPHIFHKLKKLKVLDLSGNEFEGNVPESIGNSTGLLKIDLSRNKFSGEIPANLKHLKNVELLDLSDNSFEGVVPREFGDLEVVKELNLENNNLSGRLPFSAGFVSRLGGMLRVEGNSDLCIDEFDVPRSSRRSGEGGNGETSPKKRDPKRVKHRRSHSKELSEGGDRANRHHQDPSDPGIQDPAKKSRRRKSKEMNSGSTRPRSRANDNDGEPAKHSDFDPVSTA